MFSSIEIISRRKIFLGVVFITILCNVLISAVLLYSTNIRLGTWEYQDIPKNIASGNGFVMYPGGPTVLWRPPLYIYFSAAFYYVFGDAVYIPVVLVQIILCGLTCGITYLIGEHFFSRKVGFISGLLLAIYPLFAYNNLRLMTEIVFSFLLAVTVWLTIKLSLDLNTKNSVLVGLFCGLLMLTKASTQLLPFVIFVYLFLKFRKRKKVLEIVSKGAIILVFAFATVLPWTLRNFAVTGKFLLIDTSGGYTIWIGNQYETKGFDDDGLSDGDREKVFKKLAKLLNLQDPSNSEIFESAWGSVENNNLLMREALKDMIRNPMATLELSARKISRFWFNFIGEKNEAYSVLIIFFQSLLLLIACVGIIFVYKNKINVAIILIFILYFHLIHMLSTANVRYSVPLVPYMLLFGSYGIAHLGLKFRDYKNRKKQ